MTIDFEVDPYPGRLKILFIGFGGSTHTHAWIDLLSDTKCNLRLFSVPGGGIPPPDWNIPTYICDPSSQLPKGLNPSNRRSLYPLPEEMDILERELKNKVSFKFFLIIRRVLNFAGAWFQIPPLYYDYPNYRNNQIHKSKNIRSITPDEWLAEIIQDWAPDIIHTLGVFNGQGGAFYFDLRKRFGLDNTGKWILQLRGGSDIALRRYDPEAEKQLLYLFKDCDQIITDNHFNMEYIKKLGFADKIASIAPVPGTGGIDVKQLASFRTRKASQSREIIFPKGYELAWSKCLPIFEAFQLCWDSIAPCKIHILNITPEVRSWFYTLPLRIRESCIVHDRIPRQDFFSLLANARVLLIPSLVDGVPNSLYEAMALGTFPIVSPLETIRTVVEAEKNVLFARNLYPHEIAVALTLAMSNDDLVDRAAQNNFELVEKIANRTVISARVAEYYEKLVRKN